MIIPVSDISELYEEIEEKKDILYQHFFTHYDGNIANNVYM
ncbi:hypothetical protein ACQPUI_17755 [Clostridium butyricum]